MNNNKILALIKIGEEKYMTELLREGHVYMNTVSYFSTLEQNSSRSDKDEGTGFCQNADGGSFYVKKEGKRLKLGTIEGGIRVRNEDILKRNLYCLHARIQSDDNSDFQLKELDLGNAYVLLKNADEFFRRLVIAASARGQKIKHDLVEYVDRRSYTGSMGIFKKFSEMAFQNEYRIVTFPGTGSPLSLWIGNIEDIAIIGNNNERLKIESA